MAYRPPITNQFLRPENEEARKIIEQYKQIVGPQYISCLGVFHQHRDILIRFFNYYAPDQRIYIYDVLKNHNYIKKGFKHSNDNEIINLNQIRRQTIDETKREFMSFKTLTNSEIFDKPMSDNDGSPRTQQAYKDNPCFKNIDKDTRNTIRKLLNNLYDLIHLKFFNRRYNIMFTDSYDREKNISGQKYIKYLIEARDFEDHIVYINSPDRGHQKASSIDLATNFKLEIYSEMNIRRSEELIAREIEELKQKIININPLFKSTSASITASTYCEEYDDDYQEYDDEYQDFNEYANEIAMNLIKKNTPKSQWNDCDALERLKTSQASIDIDADANANSKKGSKQKYLVNSKTSNNYEQLYMKYKTKYLELKNKLNM